MNSAFRDFLNRSWDLADRLSELLEESEVMDANCTSMTANYNKIGSSGSGGNSCDSPLAARADLVDRIKRCKQRLVDAEAELTRFCDALDRRDGQLLRYRYVLRLPWDLVQTSMQAKGFYSNSLRTLFYWHESALRRAEKLWEENYNAVANE